MSITEINDKISEVIGLLDEIEHIECSEIEPVRAVLELAQEKLDMLSNQYGDDDYEDDYDEDEDNVSYGDY